MDELQTLHACRGIGLSRPRGRGGRWGVKQGWREEVVQCRRQVEVMKRGEIAPYHGLRKCALSTWTRAGQRRIRTTGEGGSRTRASGIRA